MRRRAVGAIVGAALAVLAVGVYGIADAHDLVPGVLTLSDTLTPATAPTMQAHSGTTIDLAEQGEGTPVDAARVADLWSASEKEAADGKWTTWATVLDGATGDVLLDTEPGVTHTPASITKTLTATSALSHLNASDRLATGVSLSGTDLHLWGEGDLLLAAGAGDEDAVNGHAGLGDLATAAAKTLSERGITSVTLDWDHDLFSGSSHLSAWDEQGSGAYEGQVGAFAIDAGRAYSGASDQFVADPGSATAEALAAGLRSAGIHVTMGAQTSAPSDAEELARVESATLGQQIRWLLHHSDNTLADQYCRLAAQAAGAETTYEGAISTITSTLTDLGVDTSGLTLQDCSGLSTEDRVSGATLVQTLRASLVSTSGFDRDLVRSLPWGGLEGTLDSRFTTGAAAANVQAKTGSLPATTSLAGVVTTSGGRTLVFAIGNDAVPDDAAVYTHAPLDAFIQNLAGL